MLCNTNAPFIQNSCDFHIKYFSFSLEVNEFVLFCVKPKNTMELIISLSIVNLQNDRTLMINIQI